MKFKQPLKLSITLFLSALSLGSLNLKAEEAAQKPPFECKFSTEKDAQGKYLDFDQKWICIDQNADGATWFMNDKDATVRRNPEYKFDGDADGSDGYACVEMKSFGTTNDDYLILKNPIELKIGKAFIKFAFRPQSNEDKESLSLVYGKSTDPSSLTEIATIKTERTDYYKNWNYFTYEVDITEAGNYYFGFHAVSVDGWSVLVDDILIDQGSSPDLLDLGIIKTYHPYSSCELTMENLGLKVENFGNVEVTGVKISYSLGEINVSQNFLDLGVQSLKPGDTASFFFSEENALDMTELGDYEINFFAEIMSYTGNETEIKEEALENLANNGDTIILQHYSPEELPFASNFAYEETRTKWNGDMDKWEYDNWDGILIARQSATGSAFLSKCMNLRKNATYKLNIVYSAGMAYRWASRDTVYPESFAIKIGKQGSDLKDWETLYNVEKSYTEDAYVSHTFDYSPKEEGVYQLAIDVIESYGVLSFSTLSINEIQDYDLSVGTITSSLPVLIPARHAKKQSLEVTVQNIGLKPVTGAFVQVKYGEDVVGKSDLADIAVEKSYIFSVDCQIDNIDTEAEQHKLEVSVSMTEEDQNTTNNTKEFSFTTSETSFVFDYLETPEECVGGGLGGSTSPYVLVGNVFTLAETDTITSVLLGLDEVFEMTTVNYTIGIDIYSLKDYNPKTGDGLIERVCFSDDFRRGLEGGFRSFDIADRRLEAGDYFIGVRFNSHHPALATDYRPTGICYILELDEVGKVYRLEQSASVGSVCIRPIFEPGGEVLEHDLSAEYLDRPNKNRGDFSANQAVVLAIANNGYKATEATVKASVNGIEQSQKVEVAPYSKQMVEFEYDMSKKMRYDMVFEIEAEGDEDALNNKLDYNVECVEFDEYKLDFELCYDFDYADFIPQWTTEGKDKYISNIRYDLIFPNRDMPLGFMAFNSSEALLYESSLGQVAKSGERFGASFYTPENNDWIKSPKLHLDTVSPDGKRYPKLSFWVNALMPGYIEVYRVLISTTDNSDENFVQIGDDREVQASKSWEYVEIDLSPYANMDIYVAIQCVSKDQYVFMIDDIEVNAGYNTANESDFELDRAVEVYPNPAKESLNIKARGIEIKSVELLNLSGSKILERKSVNSSSLSLDLSKYPSAVYMLKITTANGVVYKKLLH